MSFFTRCNYRSIVCFLKPAPIRCVLGSKDIFWKPSMFNCDDSASEDEPRFGKRKYRRKSNEQGKVTEREKRDLKGEQANSRAFVFWCPRVCAILSNCTSSPESAMLYGCLGASDPSSSLHRVVLYTLFTHSEGQFRATLRIRSCGREEHRVRTRIRVRRDRNRRDRSQRDRGPEGPWR